VDIDRVLAEIARVPISEWSYKADLRGVRHMGPMAQDFYAAFHLGEGDQAYNPIDAHGVAFAAIQALYGRIVEQESRIRRLESTYADLRTTCTQSSSSTSFQ
jgi:hypothetical protein